MTGNATWTIRCVAKSRDGDERRVEQGFFVGTKRCRGREMQWRGVRSHFSGWRGGRYGRLEYTRLIGECAALATVVLEVEKYQYPVSGAGGVARMPKSS